jgi:hypothetical protein
MNVRRILDTVRGKYTLPVYVLRATVSYAVKPYYKHFFGFAGSVVLACCFFLVSSLSGEATVKRGRNEGTMNIAASNVIGNGNISLSAGTCGHYLRRGRNLDSIGFRVDPTVGLQVGISNILEFRAQTAFTNFSGLGTSDAHVQFTLPGNDRLRFFGAALCGDLYLSTTVDTISSSATSGKPEYNSFMTPSVTLDMDWLALFKSFPLKTYLRFSMADEPALLHRYEQLLFVSGFEWKMYNNSYFADIGAGFYKEKRLDAYPGDSIYGQRIVWFEPGIRYRLFGKFSLLGSFRMAGYQKLKEHRPLPATILRGAFQIVIPLLFKETNTEAIRTLVFMEREKVEKKNTITTSFEQGKRVESGLDKEFKSLQLKSDLPGAEQEKEEMKKRQEIQQKMDEIEKMLEEIQ